MTGALALLTQTVPMIIATAGTAHVVDVAMRRNGKPVGRTHYHFKGKKVVSHRHEGGHISHEHKSLRGYGRTRKSVKRF